MREKEPVTRVVFVRHGMTDFPKDRIYCDDREDPPLNETGWTEAREAADLLRTRSVDVIYTSPMARTRGTAEAIHQGTRAPVMVIGGLKERGFGIWDGLYFEDIERRYPDDYRRWKQDPAAFKPDQGESVYDLLTRVRQSLVAILEEHRGGRIVVVAHVGPIRVSLCDAVQLPVESYRRLTIDHGSLSCVDYGKRQNNLIFMNYTRSLP
jgi:broad specificity phosphatase PhoE